MVFQFNAVTYPHEEACTEDGSKHIKRKYNLVYMTYNTRYITGNTQK